MTAEATVAAVVSEADIETGVAAVMATAAASVAAATATPSTAPASARAAATSEPARGHAAEVVLLGHLLTSQLIGGGGCTLDSDLGKVWKDVIVPVAARTDSQDVLLFLLLLVLAIVILAVFFCVYL